MNKQLFDSYKKLAETEKAEMRFRLKDSPVGLSFIEFLDKCNNRNFRNSDVVQHIYKDELDKKPYAVLENRFFKLRKKIRMNSSHAPAITQHSFPKKKMNCRIAAS